MKQTLVIILIVIGIMACRHSEPAGETMPLPKDLPEGFAGFYERFLTDSIYQMEHILFPLQGLPDKADSTTLVANDFRWQEADWSVHRPIPADSDFSISFRPLTETTVVESIRHASGQYAMERRYAQFDDGWYLIYYAGLNSVGE